MNLIQCPGCDEPLPETAKYCPTCGESMTSPGHKSAEFLVRQNGDGEVETIDNSEETIQMKLADPDDTVEVMPTDPDETVELQSSKHAAARRAIAFRVPFFYSLNSEKNGSQSSHPATVKAGRNPWRREKHEAIQTMPILHDQPTLWLYDGVHAPDQEATWHKEVEPSSARTTKKYPPRPSQSVPVVLTAPRPRRRMAPLLVVWGSLALLVALLLGGLFGVIGSLGRGFFNSTDANALSLQVTPNLVAIGATMTWRGTHFTPHARIGLTRDSSIPLIDTGGARVITADSEGTFNDTIIVGQDWGPGPHTMNAEDAATHKIASFPILVTGKGFSLRPAHLHLSTDVLDFGSGDQATNSAKTIKLSNVGGGQIAWQSATTQPWLLLSPKSGIFSNNEDAQVTVAVDRSKLKPGDYSAQVVISSSAGDSTINVKMQVTPLQPGHEAVLQVSPAVLSFEATDGSASPPAQVITVSNPGVQPLHWGISADQSWLTVIPSTYLVDPSKSAPVGVRVNTSAMLPGTYRGTITFTGSGSVMHSPQSVFVSVTVMPRCSMQVSPGMLSFTSVYREAGPATKTVAIGGSQSCTSPLQWSATSNANWLTINSTRGSTPATLSVGINVSGLTPKTYNGSVTLSSAAGTQTLLVSFTLGPPNEPSMSSSPSALTFNGAVGQPSPSTQRAILTNPGGGTLTWRSTSATAIGGGWLNFTPSSGRLLPHQSVTLDISATTLAELTAGTYTGSITIIGVDDGGLSAPGSPQTIPITFVLGAACSLSASPLGLNFSGLVGQASPAAQSIAIKAGGTCANSLNWNATTTTLSGGTWLRTTSSSGAVTTSAPDSTGIAVSLNGLAAGTYHGTVTVTATDSVSGVAIGSPQDVQVTLDVQTPCTLQTPSASARNFTTEVGSNPATQTIVVGAIGACNGNITITPNTSTVSGGNWLSVSPDPATIVSGGNATFTIAVASSGLAPGQYSGTISLAATNGGASITGSPQTVGVSLTVSTTPALAVSPASITVNTTTGVSSHPITIQNTGGGPLNWTAALQAGAPGFVSLSSGAGTGLDSGASTTLNVIVDATGVTGGQSYTANVVVSAIDPVTGNPTAGSPVTVPITINVAAPSMQVSATNLAFSVNEGSNPGDQSIVISNTGGNSLTWSVGGASQSWLSVNPTSGSNVSGASTNATFSVNASGLATSATPYVATVVITPSVGAPVTVTVTLTVTGVTPTPTPTASATPEASPTPTPTPPSSVATQAPPLSTPGVQPVPTQIPAQPTVIPTITPLPTI